MFVVEDIETGGIYMAYAVSGPLILIWNDDTEDEHWEWMDMDRLRPSSWEG